MRYFFCGAFYSGIAILMIASAFGQLDKVTTLAIWTAGMAVGLLGTRPSA